MHPPHTPLPTYNNASRTRRTPPTPDDASRMQYRHKLSTTRHVPPALALAPSYYLYCNILLLFGLNAIWLWAVMVYRLSIGIIGYRS